MDRFDQKNMRRRVARTLLVSTLVFFLLLGGAFYLQREIPLRRLARIEALLDAGDYAAARPLTERVDDEALAEGFRARCDYLEGVQLMDSGRWAEARELLANAGSYADAAERVQTCSYALAEALLADGEYDAAAEAFASLGGYGDAADRALGCRYEKALALEEGGDAAGAAEIYEHLGSYRDSAVRLRRLAVVVTGISDGEEALEVLHGLSREDREKMLALKTVRESLPHGVLAVGFYHTVGLQADGTVVACGDNSCGQCDVGALHGVSAVAAGAYHTVALHADGTVSALGRNSEGECNTAEWRNVTAIAAADYATFGLTRDGTLLCTGVNDYTEPSQWSGLGDVAGGSYNLAALREDGSVWSYPALKGLDALRGAEAIDVNTGYAVAVMADGRAMSTAFDLSAWHDIVAVSASGTAILALDAEGRICAHFFRQSDAVDFSSVSGAVAIAAGGTHFAVVLSDGSVRVFGENAHGEAETGGWTLKVN